MNILVVDDDHGVADTTAQLLNIVGYRALAIYSGQEAVEHARMMHFDLALVGVIMPEMNGMETAIRIRKASPQCQVILWVEDVPAELLQWGKSQGYCFEHILGPLGGDYLLNRIRQFEPQAATAGPVRESP